MLFGLNLLLFGDTVDREMLRTWFGRVKEIGFDGVEVPIFDAGSLNTDMIRGFAERYELQLTASGAMPKGARFYGNDTSRREVAERYLREGIRAASELGAPVFCGPFYKALGDVGGHVPVEEQRARTADALRPLAEFAWQEGVRLAIEPLNRFETDFLNTALDGIGFVRAIGSPGAGLLLDTFHMHIEEKDSARAIESAGEADALVHFHASENDRGMPGSGQVCWQEVSDALEEADYDHWVVLETFNQENRAIRRAVSCWRPFYESEEAFMRDGLAFVKDQFDPAQR